MYKAIFFDFDDTLVDTKSSKAPAIIEYCSSVHGIDVSEHQIAGLWGIPFLRMMRQLTGSTDINIERYLAISEGYSLVPFPESYVALSTLSERVPIGIVTSLARQVLLHSLTALRWPRAWFSVLVTEDDVDVHKPDPRVFDPALRALDIEVAARHQVMYVGDSESDGKAAIAAGLTFVGIARDAERQRLFEIKGWECCSSLEALLHTIHD